VDICWNGGKPRGRVQGEPLITVKGSKTKLFRGGKSKPETATERERRLFNAYAERGIQKKLKKKRRAHFGHWRNSCFDPQSWQRTLENDKKTALPARTAFQPCFSTKEKNGCPKGNQMSSTVHKGSGIEGIRKGTPGISPGKKNKKREKKVKNKKNVQPGGRGKCPEEKGKFQKQCGGFKKKLERNPHHQKNKP